MQRNQIFRTGLIVLGLCLTAFGQETDGESLGTASRLFDHFVVSGGVITWLVLIPLSVAMVALIVEHALSIRQSTLLPPLSITKLTEEIKGRRYSEAAQSAASDPSMIGQVLHSAMAEASYGFAAMEQAMGRAIEERAARLYRKIEYLNIIGSVSPMIGLFGTVYGMIRLFASIKEAGGIPEPSRIASDISIALVTTFWGLLVAIPALSAFSIFRNRIDMIAVECMNEGETILDLLRAPTNTAQQAKAKPKAPQNPGPSGPSAPQA